MARLTLEDIMSNHISFKGRCILYGTRCLLSAISAGLAMAYIFIWLFDERVVNINYLTHSAYMPGYMYIVLFATVAIVNFVTADAKHRLSVMGRVAALFGGSVFLLYALTYVPTISLTAVFTYSIISLVFFWESFGEV